MTLKFSGLLSMVLLGTAACTRGAATPPANPPLTPPAATAPAAQTPQPAAYGSGVYANYNPAEGPGYGPAPSQSSLPNANPKDRRVDSNFAKFEQYINDGDDAADSNGPQPRYDNRGPTYDDSRMSPQPGPNQYQGPNAFPGPAPAPNNSDNEARNSGSGGNLDALMQWERRDLGVPPTRELHRGAMHGPTPNQIPGGQVITTKGLVPLLQQHGALLLDVLGAPQKLPGAIAATPAAQPGDFNDQAQQGFGQFLQQLTQGRNDVPIVLYCGGPECWASYNAALRAINLGYRNVAWYRGGMQAWQMAGLQFESAGGYPPQQGAPPAGSYNGTSR